MSQGLRLYTTPRSANGRKVLAAVHHLGLQPVLQDVDVYRGEGRSPDYLAINPTGKIPALVDGSLVLTESNAILLFLDEAYGGYRLSSREPKVRADATRWLFWEAAHWQPALTRVLGPCIGHALLPQAVPAPAGPPDWDDAELAPLLGHLERHLQGRRNLVGDTLSVADFGVGGMATYFAFAGFPADRFPGIAGWLAGLEANPAWAATAVEPWV